MNYPALLSFICGFASLSLEILWVRLYSFANLSSPAAFGFVLAAYLLGIAIGAHIGSKACRQVKTVNGIWLLSIYALLLSAACTILLPRAFSYLIFKGVHNPLVDLILIALSSSILAFIFPIAHHIGSNKNREKQGRKLAFVYTSNVLGGALGPIATGYVLLDHFTLQMCFQLIALLQLTAAIFFLLLTGINRAYIKKILIICTVAFIVTSLKITQNPQELIQQLSSNGNRATTIIENRHGIITLFQGENNDDLVFGGNVYDGRTNLDPEKNTNGLHRPLLLNALHPEPKRVLMIGLSIGTWLALINEFSGVKLIDVIEINPGYIQAAQKYPLQTQALQDPRVNIIIGDARRWLRLNSDLKYDLVVMNNTWHWRANSSLLLSEEFLSLLKPHMTHKAILAFNSTGSNDTFFTASNVFSHAYRYDNFVYAGDYDFRAMKSSPQALEGYKNMLLNKQPFFKEDSTMPKLFLDRPFITIEHAKLSTDRPLEVVTDKNMITEFKYGRKLY
jgi:spermidine synthase